ncbi:uncharacterized protein LOC117647926 [Thrips palmi]|uniref:Uncharacterized protein LOC117647926 n=1 Tax=Thrips palmi TaxID=161013 RepID=A0A6P8Z049_THRPL|nr:uncharacterized protein LOC117647926 [Thrips palmi]
MSYPALSVSLGPPPPPPRAPAQAQAQAAEERREASGSGTVIGIDFGTTNMVVAALVDDDVEILSNDIGARTTPSCVHVLVPDGPQTRGLSTRRACEERQTGEAALRLAVTDPDKTLRNVKRVIGRSYRSVMTDPAKPLMGPIRLAPGVGDSVRIRLGFAELCPEEVVGSLLLELRKFAESQLNHEVRRAVMAVPSYFNIAQRQAIIDAARLAGLNTVQLVNETTAAALAYARDREDEKNVVVVDVGGGGGAVSVVRVKEGAVWVVCTSMKRLPGGEDIDSQMMMYLRQVIKQEHGKEVRDLRSAEILRSCWEKSKQKLSRIPQVELSTYLPGPDLEFKHIISRAQFEKECQGLFGEIIHAIRDIAVTGMNALAVQEYDSVVLVGGSTRIPVLRNEINRMFPNKVHKALNPDEAVAQGAALLAAGTVRLEREVLGLNTWITMGDTSYTRPCATVLGLKSTIERRPLTRMTYQRHRYNFSVEQASPYDKDALITIYDDQNGCPVKLHFDMSGTLNCYDADGALMYFTPRFCLDKSRLNMLQRKIERQLHSDKSELERTQAKNSLENFIRDELSKELIHDKSLEEEQKLKGHCKEVLDQISVDPNMPKERANDALSYLSSLRIEIDNARHLAAVEVQKKELREAISNYLAELLRIEVCEDDPAFDLTSKLRPAWLEDQEWLLAHGEEASLQELEQRAARLKQAVADVEAVREERRLQAKAKLASCVDALKISLESADDLLGFNDEKLKQDMNNMLSKCLETTAWLERHPNAQITDYECQLKHLAPHEKHWNELSQKLFKIALEQKLKDVMAQCPNDEDWCTRYSEKFISVKSWLDSKLQVASTEELRQKLLYVRKEAAMFAKDFEQNRLGLLEKLKTKLHSLLSMQTSSDMPCFPLALQLQSYCRSLNIWVEEHPAPTREEISEHLTDLNKRAAEFKRDQTRTRRKNLRTQLCQLVRGITFRKVHENDIVRDLEHSLQALCSNNYVVVLADEKLNSDQLESYLNEVREKEKEIKEEREKRTAARDSLQKALDLVMKEGNLELVAPFYEWIQSHPAVPADEFDMRRLHVLGEAGITALSCRPTKLEKAMPQISPPLDENVSKSDDGTGVEVKCELLSQISNTDENDNTCEKESKVDKVISDIRVMTLMSTLWDRAQTDPLGWAVTVAFLPAKLLESQLEVLRSLSTALAVEILRVAQVGGGMALLVDRRQSEARCLLSLSVRYLDERGKPVERLLVVRLAQICSSDGEALAQSFLALCERAQVHWQAILVGVSAEAAGPEGRAFVQCLQALSPAPIEDLVNAAVPLEDRVALACYARLREKHTYQVAVQFFSTMDMLRSLFAVDSPWFPLLRETCASLSQEDLDPWATYSSAIAFVSAEREGIVKALHELANVEGRHYQVVAVLTDALSLSSQDNGFNICLASFRNLFAEAAKFFGQAGLPTFFNLEHAGLLAENPFPSVEAVLEQLVRPVRRLVAGRVWSMEKERDMCCVVSTCVEVTAQAMERARQQMVHVADILNHPVSEAAGPSVFGNDFTLEIQQLGLEHAGKYRNLYSALGGVTLEDFQARFPHLHRHVVRALVAPVLPAYDRKSTEQLRDVFQRTASCPADRVGDFAMLVANEKSTPTMSEAVRILNHRL